MTKKSARRPRPKSSPGEPAVDHYDNGEVRFRGTYVDAKIMHGDWTFYRKDGSLMRSGQFDHGRQIGVWKTFDREGRVVKETDFTRSSRD